MGPVNKFEAVGIFVSIAIMAVALAVIRFEADELNFFANEDTTPQGAIIVASEPEEAENPNAPLADALVEASTVDGEIISLVIDDITFGSGQAVKKGDTVSVDYIGSTQDGVQFDSSYARGQRFEFTVGDGKVIEGWEQGLIGMQVGGERILVIPGSLAYGNRQVGPIPPNATLVFAIELHEIK